MHLYNNTDKSHGGLCLNYLYLLPARPEHQWGPIIEGTHKSVCIPNGDMDWEKFYFIRNSALVKEEKINVKGAELWKSEITLVINGDSAYIRSTTRKLRRKKWHVKYQDDDGVTKVMGGTNDDICSVDFPVINGGRERSDRREMEVVFTCISRLPISIYSF